MDKKILDLRDARVRLKIKKILGPSQKGRVTRSLNCRRAGVLIILYHKSNEPHVLLIRRSMSLKEHRGEISLPGGALEGSDSDALDAALREVEEEVGIRVSRKDILGKFDDVQTLSTNYTVSPYLAFLSEIPRVKANPEEVSEVLEVKLAELMNPENLKREVREIGGVRKRTTYFQVGGRKIWGATARILIQLTEMLRLVN